MARRPIAWLLLLLPLAASAEPLAVEILGVDGKGVAGVVVYLEGGNAPETPAAQPLDIQQKDRRFAPYIGAVRRNDPVLFSNHDDITHHVYSFNGPARFAFQLQPGEVNTAQRFAEAGVVAMGCNIHDWMSGYLLVLDNPWFATTDETGLALIANVPPGRYRLVAWHPQLREATEPAAFVDMPASTVTLRLSAQMADIPRQEGLEDFDFLEAY